MPPHWPPLVLVHAPAEQVPLTPVPVQVWPAPTHMRVVPPKAASVVMGMQQPLELQALPEQQGWPGPPHGLPVPEVPPVVLPPVPTLPPLPRLASRSPEPPALEPPALDPPRPPAPPLPLLVLLLLLHPTSHKAAMPASKPAPSVRLVADVSKLRLIMRSPFALTP